MLSVSPSSLARSSLEEMLESLRQRDEVDKAKDMPPALPVRPRATSRKRLPSAKRSLPPKFKIGDSELPECSSNVNIKKDDMKGSKCNRFVAKKIKEMDQGESPYVVVSENAKCEPESDENLEYFTEKKLCVWCRCLNGLWESGLIQSTSGDKALVLLSDGSVVTVPTVELLPANPDILEGVDDLIQLSYLNRPSVLHNLQYRYSRDMIYSKAGPVLIAVNPLKDVDIYGNEFVTAYREKLLDGPHVYAIAETAYNKMITDDINQSIIISGESGAGKTETAKIAMQYLASVGGGPGGIESEVFQTSCILEAFGNAKTSRNNNSSRFGKLIEIHFSATGNMCGAKIQTFLLEKSRVVRLAHGERSYHIFYQLCAGVPSALRGRLRLKMPSDYNYLIQSGCLTINDVDDAQKFHSLVEALNSVGICQEDQEHAFEMLAAVLWLGNISFHVMDTENHIEVVVDEAVSNAASLIGCSTEDLIVTLSRSRIQASTDNVVKEQTLQQAKDTRDSLAKFIYASLFDWVVEEINKSLIGNHHTGRSISILDVYGFESFQKNSLEQFCINYANERLQQHFNRHLFKLEQEEYELDGIDWTKVEFEDNQDRLDLFEKHPTGLISLLDEESSSSEGSELTFATKLKQYLIASSCFKGGTGGAFSIRHYAGEVLYDTGEFLEKNRDLLHSDTIQLLSSCSGQLPRLFTSTWLNQSQKAESSSIHLGMSACQKQSVAAKFKSQVFRLMRQLENTTPHFIQCIKPNSKQLPGTFEKDLVSEQLRYCGILEVARISRFGYPTRMTHREFARRYACLLPENNACQNPLSTSVSILQQLGIPPEMYQVGYRKLYFRAGQIGVLEDVREQVLQGTLEVQKCLRSRACQNFHELREGVIMLQSFVRGDIARRKYGALLGSNEPVALQKIEDHVVQIQSGIRGWLARRKYSELQNSKHVDHRKWKGDREVSEVKDIRRKMSPSVVEELQRRVLLAEATLEQKEKENASLKDQVQQFEAQWPEYEAKMKSMEDVWQKQMVSLQMSLAAAKKSLCAENVGQPGRNHGSPSPCYYDSEDTSIGTRTPGGGTPVKFHYNVLGLGAIQETNGGLNAVNPLLKEFEERKQTFEDEARAITESKSGQSPSVNTIDELRKLKHRFEYWKKDYKARLKEAKAKAIRLGHSEAEKHRRSWWGKKSKKIQQ